MSYQHNRRPLKNHHQNRKRQEGVVIVVALFIVALVATMSYFMMSRLMRDTQRTSLILRNAQAEFYTQGSITWAMDQLRNNWEQKKPNKLVDVIPTQSPPTEVNGYTVTGTIYDMQSRFNLNNVSAPEGQLVFKHLLQLVSPKITPAIAQAITAAVVDWITPGIQQGELTRYYLALPEPYRPAHRLMQSATELRLVKGVTPALFNALQPYITALPASTPVNVQTAPAIVLAALSPTMTLEAGQAIERLRATKPFTGLDIFNGLDIVKNHPIKPESLITVTSGYFLLETKVTMENQGAVIYTLMERASKDQTKAVVNILWQSKGVW